MKYTSCEKLLWLAMSGTIFNWLQSKIKNNDIKKWKRDSKSRYKQIISEIDEIGSIMKNPLRMSLDGGALWIAIYETAPIEMSNQLFEGMVKITMTAPLVRKAFEMKKPFTIKNQKAKIEMEKTTNSISDSPFNWQTHTTMGRDENEYTTTYTRCGLCELGRKYHHEELIPLMCQMDYISISVMGGILDRTQTLATGGECCDFHVIKKGSKWDNRFNQQ